MSNKKGVPKTKANHLNYVKRRQLNRTINEREIRYFTMQMVTDFMLVMLSDKFGFGAERLKRATDGLAEVCDYYADLFLDDAECEEEIAYAKEKLDKKLKEICGEYFEPWDERYN